MKPAATFSELLQGFFTDRLMGQCNASALTIANYRDAFCLLIAYAQRSLKKPPTKLTVQDLDAPFIARFLDYLERERGNSPRSRNVRLAAGAVGSGPSPAWPVLRGGASGGSGRQSEQYPKTYNPRFSHPPTSTMAIQEPGRKRSESSYARTH